VADRQMLAARLGSAAAELPSWRAKLANVTAAASTRPITLDGASDGIAAANLQSQIDKLTASGGIKIASIEGLQAESREEYRRIGLRIAVAGTYGSVIELLTAIEAATPPLVLGDLDLHEANSQTGAPASGRIDAVFEVYGFRSNETPVAVKQ
jgi:general secretion pathway protein M